MYDFLDYDGTVAQSAIKQFEPCRNSAYTVEMTVKLPYPFCWKPIAFVLNFVLHLRHRSSCGLCMLLFLVKKKYCFAVCSSSS